MYRSCRLICLACGILLAAACATQAPTVPDGPERVLSSFVSALNRADIDAVTDLLAPDATAFLPLDSYPAELIGRDAIRAALSAFFEDLRLDAPGPEYMHIVPRNVHIQSSGHTVVITFDAGSGPVTSRRTLVAEETPGGWRITHFHGSNIRRTASGPEPG